MVMIMPPLIVRTDLCPPRNGESPASNPKSSPLESLTERTCRSDDHAGRSGQAGWAVMERRVKQCLPKSNLRQVRRFVHPPAQIKALWSSCQGYYRVVGGSVIHCWLSQSHDPTQTLSSRGVTAGCRQEHFLPVALVPRAFALVVRDVSCIAGWMLTGTPTCPWDCDEVLLRAREQSDDRPCDVPPLSQRSAVPPTSHQGSEHIYSCMLTFSKSSCISWKASFRTPKGIKAILFNSLACHTLGSELERHLCCMFSSGCLAVRRTKETQ